LREAESFDLKWYNYLYAIVRYGGNEAEKIMAGNINDNIEYHVRTVVGYLIIIVGIIGCMWLMWWLISRGDIVEIIHNIKMSLPGWAWAVMKYGLSIAFGLVVMGFFIMLGVIVLGTGGRARTGEGKR
jgi:hypothetical protein